MATKFEEIYGLFLSQITDYELGNSNLSQEELVGFAEMYLLNSLLTIQNSVGNDIFEINMDNKEFVNNLRLQEKLLIAKSMKLSWVQRQKYRQELMRKSIGDRDYKAVQGTDYLRALTEVEESLSMEIRRDLIRDSWRQTDAYSRLRN